MPKNTFYNLPEEKKEKILRVSIDEFEKYSYDKASISRIVKNAGIAKGSFYQYFEDKKDLFKYIINKSGERKLKYLTEVMTNLQEYNFFQTIREIYIAGVKFSKDNPKLSTIAINFIKNGDEALKKEVLGENESKGNEFIKMLILKGVKKGDVDPEIDVDLVAHMITSLSISISEYFIREVKVDDDMEIMNLIDKMLYVIENGIKNS